jgi:peptidoglycan/LPS O-acetylase OafA/YrhL
MIFRDSSARQELPPKLEIEPPAGEGLKPAARYEPILRPAMPELDTIRGLAILAVVYFHGIGGIDTTNLGRLHRLLLRAGAGGRLGVNLFFVLSGFLITGLLLDSRDRPDYYKRFYTRRALRILPLYFVILALLAVTQVASLRFVALSFLYAANLTPLFGVEMGFPVLWSLAVEEHFYLIWPAAVRRLSARSMLRICMVIITVSPFIRLLCFYSSPHEKYHFFCEYYTWCALYGLSCGAAISILVRLWEGNRNKLLGFSLALIALGVVIEVAGTPFGIASLLRPVGIAFLFTPWNLAFTGALGLFLLAGTTRWKGIVNMRFLRFYGYISYGLYLIHELVFLAYDRLTPRFLQSLTGTAEWKGMWLRFFCCVGVATLIAYFSRRYFEGPMLSLKGRYSASR